MRVAPTPVFHLIPTERPLRANDDREERLWHLFAFRGFRMSG